MTNVFTELNKLDHLHLLDITEAKAFLGLLISIDVLRGRREPLEQLWDDKWGRAIFRATVGINRFKLILRHISFDDKATRTHRRATDKLAAIRLLFRAFFQKVVKSITNYHFVQLLMNNCPHSEESVHSACT